MKNIVKILLVSGMAFSTVMMNAQEERLNYGRNVINNFYTELKDYLKSTQRIPLGYAHEDLYRNYSRKLSNLADEDKKQLAQEHVVIARRVFDEALENGTSDDDLKILGYEIDCISCRLAPMPDCLILLEDILTERGREDLKKALPSLSTDHQNSK